MFASLYIQRKVLYNIVAKQSKSNFQQLEAPLQSIRNRTGTGERLPNLNIAHETRIRALESNSYTTLDSLI